MSAQKMWRRLAILESGFKTSFTVVQIKDLVIEVPSEVLGHLLPRLALKLDPDSPPLSCSHCGDPGLASNGAVTCAGVLAAEAREGSAVNLLRDLERAIDGAPRQLLAEALILAQRELEQSGIVSVS
jgi:hypothetical protein